MAMMENVFTLGLGRQPIKLFFAFFNLIRNFVLQQQQQQEQQ